jgi:hypothetical protein
MKTENHSINDVLTKNATSFFIPPFQRAYAWGKPEIERYFSDVIRIIKSELNPKEHDKLEHFLGTVVIKEESQGFASKSVVVDGQQRLTTTLLFLIALRDIEDDIIRKQQITDLYLKNNTSDFEDKIKLKQVTRDWEAYKALVNGQEPNAGIIRTAYQIFKEYVNDNFTTHEDFINDIIRFVPCYKWIISEIVNDAISFDIPKDKEIKELLRNIFHDIKAEAFKPFVLGLLEYNQQGVDGLKLSDDKLIEILNVIRTYLIRRRILGLTQGENKNILSLINRICDLSNSTVSMI